jgi:hypothetical protein
MLTYSFNFHLITVLGSICLLISCPASGNYPNQNDAVSSDAPDGLYEESGFADTKNAVTSSVDDGMGYKVLNNTDTFQSQVREPNTIYEIRTVFNLADGGGKATIPDGCVLKFNGGKLKNGTIIGNNTEIDAPRYLIFDNCTLSGFTQPLHSKWWCVLDGRDNTAALQNAFNSVGQFGTLILDRGEHLISDTVIIPDNCIQVIGDSESGMYPMSAVVFKKTSGTCLRITKHPSLPTITISGISIYGQTNSATATKEGKFGYYANTTAIDNTNDGLSPNIHMTNCRIEHFACIVNTRPNSYYNSFDFCRFFYFEKALYGLNANNLSVVGCRVANGYQFLYLASGDGQTIIDRCAIENVAGRAIEVGTSIGKLTLSNSYIELAEPCERFIYGKIFGLSIMNNEIQNNGCWRTIEFTAPNTIILQGNHWRFDKDHNNFDNGMILIGHETLKNLQTFVWQDSFQNLPSSAGYSNTYKAITSFRCVDNKSQALGFDPVQGNQISLIP